MWDTLIAILAEMVKLYEALLQLSRLKRDILVSGKPQELETLTKQEEFLIFQIGKLEGQRQRTAKEIAGMYGVQGDSITLEQMRQLADPRTAESLAALNANLEKIVSEITPLNQINSDLIRKALDFINFNINLLTQSNAEPTYTTKGQNNQAAKPRALFDLKA